MTTNEAIQHPNTDKIVNIAIGAAIGLALQHGIDLHEQVATLTQFFSSTEGHTVVMAVLVILAKVRDGMKGAAQPIAGAATQQQPDIASLVEAAVFKAIDWPNGFVTTSQVIQPSTAATQDFLAKPPTAALTATATTPPAADNPARVS
jgi:hypothetical protein